MKFIPNNDKDLPKLHKAFTSFLESMSNPVNNKKGYGYYYTTLSDVLNLIRNKAKAQGLGFTQDIGIRSSQQGQPWVSCQSILISDYGSIVSGTLSLPVQQSRGRSGAQAYGSALTYTKRYSATAFVGISGADDDGAASSGSSYRSYGNNYRNYNNNNYNSYRSSYRNGYGNNNYNNNNGGNNNQTTQPVQGGTTTSAYPATNAQKRRLKQIITKLFTANNKTATDGMKWFKNAYHTSVDNVSMINAKKAISSLSSRLK